MCLTTDRKTDRCAALDSRTEWRCTVRWTLKHKVTLWFSHSFSFLLLDIINLLSVDGTVLEVDIASLLFLSHTMDFCCGILKCPIMQKLNSPACVRVWEKWGEYYSQSHKSSCARTGKYLCWASARQLVTCLFSSFIFMLCCSCFHNSLWHCLSAWAPPLPLTPFPVHFQ